MRRRMIRYPLIPFGYSGQITGKPLLTEAWARLWNEKVCAVVIPGLLALIKRPLLALVS